MSENKLYIELYYSLLFDPLTKVTGYSSNNFICSQINDYAQNLSFYMKDKDGKQNQNIMTYFGCRTITNPILDIPQLFYEYLNITTPENDIIQGFSNYTDAGSGSVTISDFEDFAVTTATGIFEGATLIRIFYNPDLTRIVVITNETTINSLPKQIQNVNNNQNINNIQINETSNGKEITLYYSTIVSKETPISNASITDILNYTPINTYCIVSNRFMQNEDGTKNNIIISYISLKSATNNLLEILAQSYETLIIITPNGDKLQASSIYTDTGTSNITTVPFQDFPVDGGLGIFIDAKNVRVIYDNENFTRKVIITDYFPDPSKINLTKKLPNNQNQFPITLYYSTILSPLVPIPNLSILDSLLYSPASTFGEFQVRYMIDEDWKPNENIICIFQCRIPQDNIISFPAYNFVFANIHTPNGDTLNGYIGFVNSDLEQPLAIIKISVCSASGIFEGAKQATLFFDNITRKNKIVITN